MGTGNDRSSDDKVLMLASASAGTQKINQIERYWNTVRGNRLVPSRCEIDPRGLEGVLGDAFILERITGGLARFRIAGSKLADLTGVELRQMPLSALFVAASREVLAEALVSVFEDPAVVRMEIASPGGFGRARLEGELILLPLRSDLGDVDRVLGGIVFDGPAGRSPRRIEIVSQVRTSLTGYAGPAHKAPPPAVQVRRPVSVDLPHGRPRDRRTERPHLRLVVSND